MDYLQFGQLALAAMVTFMVLKFLFKMVTKKFDEQNLQQVLEDGTNNRTINQ